MTAIPRFEPLAPRFKTTGAGGVLGDFRLSPLPPRMIAPSLDEALARPARRTRIWELSHHVHCSIVGTCLSTGDLRQLLAKAGIADSGASEHDLHGRGVALASQRDGSAKLLHKALDRKHRTAIARFDKARTIDAVRAEWREAVKQGDIPGAYWAAMTHPATDDALVREIFGEVHMLSHLVGAANRADIRRLAELEAENGKLRDKLSRQQNQLRDGITARDAWIRELNGLLASCIAEDKEAGRADDASERAALEGLVAGLEQRLRAEANRRAAVEERLARATDELAREREQHAVSRRQEGALRHELEAVEAGFHAETTPQESMPSSLAGLSLLYVGGRTDRLGHLRSLSEERGAQLLHHDGGVDDRSGLLAGLVSRADIVMFPVDCVSHEAVLIVKRVCRQMSKPYLPLRSTGISSFVAALGSEAVMRFRASASA
jgi:hypothetical protein